MIVYLLQVSLCWAFFYLIYHLFLRKETFFRINRVYLMATLLLSLFIPQLGYFVHDLLQTSPSELGQVIYYVSETPQIISNIILPEEESTHWSILLLTVFYFAGVLFVAARFIFGISRIIQLYRSGTKIPKTHFTLVETKKAHLPFSFFQWVFLSKKVPLKKEIREVISHELCHVQSLHSLDIIALELLLIIFWFNPILILYKKALRQAHEYTADASVLVNSDVKNYGQILLGQTSSGLEVALANHFFNSQLKNRITMMYQKKSGKKALLKYLAAIPILLLTAFLFSNSVLKDKALEQNYKSDLLEVVSEYPTFSATQAIEISKVNDRYLNETNLSRAKMQVVLKELQPELGYEVSLPLLSIPTEENDTIPNSINGSKNHPVAKSLLEKMPLFSGCDDNSLSKKEKISCSKKKMLQYLYTEIKYPKSARTKGIEGTIMVEFLVTKEGKIAETKILQSLDEALDNEAMQVVNHMNNLSDSWIPGKINGKSADVRFVLPIRFKLEGNTPNSNEKSDEIITFPSGSIPLEKIVVVGYKESITTPPLSENEEIFKVVEEMPRFPGCENSNGSKQEKESCAKTEMLQYIYKNLKYPTEARDNGVEGMVVIQFVVDKTGTVRDAEIIREIGSNCGTAAKAVVQSMNNLPEKWTPGKQKGIPVNVVYTLPVRFKLSGKKTKGDNVKVSNTKTVPQDGLPKMREDGVFLAVESMPRFPGCEDQSLSRKEVDQCAKKELLQYIYSNVTYPKEARDAGTQGTTVIQFVVTKEGAIRDAKIVRDIGKGCGQVALEVVESMNTLSEKWIPGEQNGEKVDVAYTLPIRFKIQDKTSEPITIRKKTLPSPDPSKDPLYIIDGTIMDKGSKMDLQPSDIKSISVLKDASAIDKYGEAARNGAIEITTKNGKSNTETSDQEKITFKSAKPLDLEGVDDKFLVILNDQPANIPLEEMKLDPNDIDRINVLKGEAAVKKYGEKGENGVLEIYLLDKNFNLPDGKELYSVNKPAAKQILQKIGNPLVVLDEIVIGRGTKVIENLDPKDIKSIQVYKDESAVEKYGSEGKEGVIEIITHSKNYQETGILPKEIGTLKKSSFLEEFKAFPIPSKGSINLQIEGNEGPLQIRVFSLTGQMIHSEDFNSFSGRMVTKLQNPAFANATAIIAVIQEGKVQTKKVVFN